MAETVEILKLIRKSVKQRHPDAEIYLYGSRVRGDAKNDSDWDLLILLNKDTITPEIEESVTYPLYDLEIEFGEVISPMVYSKKEWNNKYKVTPFYRSVMQEGKAV